MLICMNQAVEYAVSEQYEYVTPEMLLLMCFCLSSLAMEAQKAPHERDFPTRREARRMMKLIKRADHQEDYVRQWYKRQK